MKPFQMGEEKWSKAVVADRLDECSYEVEAGDAVCRCNRVQMKKTPELPQSERQHLEPGGTTTDPGPPYVEQDLVS